MRWDELFADLEAQLAAADSAELAAEVADRTRREAARLALVDRLRGAAGARVTVRVDGAGALEGTLTEVGRQWVLLGEASGLEVLVPIAAVLSVSGLRSRTAAAGSAGQVFDRLGLGSALRAIARDRASVALVLRDGSTLAGTVDRVGADFLELSAQDLGERSRGGPPGPAFTVPVAALAIVRRTG